MSDLDVDLKAALSGAAALMFVALEVDLAVGPLRLLDGAGMVSFAGRTFVGGDPTLGVIAGLETFQDGGQNEAPSARIIFHPPTNAASAAFNLPTNQGRAVNVWVGAASPADGEVIGEPYLLFAGVWDQGHLHAGQSTRTVTLDCVSALETFFEDDEGVRLNQGWHESVWPSELGLDFVYDVRRENPWGRDDPKPAFVRYSGNQPVTYFQTPLPYVALQGIF